MDKPSEIKFLRNAIRGAISTMRYDSSDTIHAVSALFSKTLGRDTVREARDAALAALSEKERTRFNATFPGGYNPDNNTGSMAGLSLESIYCRPDAALALSVIALKKDMPVSVLREAFPSVLDQMNEATVRAEMRERFPDMKGKHIRNALDKLAVADLQERFPKMKKREIRETIAMHRALLELNV